MVWFMVKIVLKVALNAKWKKMLKLALNAKWSRLPQGKYIAIFIPVLVNRLFVRIYDVN